MQCSSRISGEVDVPKVLEVYIRKAFCPWMGKLYGRLQYMAERERVWLLCLGFYICAALCMWRCLGDFLPVVISKGMSGAVISQMVNVLKFIRGRGLTRKSGLGVEQGLFHFSPQSTGLEDEMVCGRY